LHLALRNCGNTSGERRITRLAITKDKKSEIYQGYLKALEGAQGMVITEYRGMTMKSLNGMRGILRPIKARYAITKNTIFKIALQESGFAVPEDLFVGPTAVAIAYGDLGGLTKAVLGRQKDDDKLILKGAIMGTTVFRADQLEVLSTLPSLEQARASLIGTLQQPASKIIGLLAQPGQELAMVLKAYTDKNGEAA
jgi:large subunit ribosomal protein L10